MDVAEGLAGPAHLALDPFGFQPGIASKIVGLGGSAPGHDHDYVFHTSYVEVAEGPAHFFVRFEGLTARQGTLVLRVHMLPNEEGAHATLANSERISLNRLIQHGGHIAVRFEGFRNVTFALYAAIAGNTDAEARELTVTLDRPADPAEHRAVALEVRGTAYGNTPVKPSPRLLSADRPTLADPVSQIATQSQLREAAAAEWLGQLDLRGAGPSAQWRAVYTMQVLRRYGLLEPGARGLGFDVGGTMLPAAAAAHGASVVATYAPGDHEDDASARAALGRPRACDDAAFARIAVQPAALALVPDALRNFDFLWSAAACERLGSVTAGIQFVQDAMACLRPGGLAVHTMDYGVGADDGMMAGDATLFQRRHAERLSLMLISRGHEVAQFKFDARDALLEPPEPGRPPARRAVSSIGLIVRKARPHG